MRCPNFVEKLLLFWCSLLSAVHLVCPGLTVVIVSIHPTEGAGFHDITVFLFNLHTLMAAALTDEFHRYQTRSWCWQSWALCWGDCCSSRLSLLWYSWPGQFPNGSFLIIAAWLVPTRGHRYSLLQLRLWPFQIKEAPQSQHRRHWKALHQPLFCQFTTG